MAAPLQPAVWTGGAIFRAALAYSVIREESRNRDSRLAWVNPPSCPVRPRASSLRLPKRDSLAGDESTSWADVQSLADVNRNPCHWRSRRQHVDLRQAAYTTNSSLSLHRPQHASQDANPLHTGRLIFLRGQWTRACVEPCFRTLLHACMPTVAVSWSFVIKSTLLVPAESPDLTSIHSHLLPLCLCLTFHLGGPTPLVTAFSVI